MKVLIAHNRYRSATPSGENEVVDSEIEMLRDAGVEVIPFIEDSDELEARSPSGLLNAAIGPVISPRGVSRFKQVIAERQPDVMHLHNVFPLISPWIVRVAASAGIPIVQTVHNYRHTCVAGMHLRDGAPCEECVGKKLALPAIRYGCYRGSRSQSMAMAAGHILHRSTWRLVDRYLVTNLLIKDQLIEQGIDPARVEWRTPYVPDPGAAPIESGRGVAFVGRLEHQKGIDLLLSAWTKPVSERWGRLVIVGDGPLSDMVREAAARDPTIDWRGSLDQRGVCQAMADTQLLAVPSIWWEGFPRVIAEALALGRPILMWEGLAVRELADLGMAWSAAANATAWEQAMLHIDEVALRSAAPLCRDFYERRGGHLPSLDQLLSTYHSAKGAAA